jgi:phage-related tail fiber protein
MASTQTDRIGTVDSSKAIKVPCRVATTADLTPSLSGGALGSGGGGLFTIDGVALAAGDRVLVKNQADQTTNGIYVATSTAWQRASDFQDNRAVVSGTIVLVTNGTASAGLWFELTTANPITIGSSNITFAVTSNPTVSSAMAPVVGAPTLGQARTAMGSTTVGDALFTAASASAARLTLGYPSAAGTLAGESIGQGVEDDGAGGQSPDQARHHNGRRRYCPQCQRHQGRLVFHARLPVRPDALKRWHDAQHQG